MQKPVHLRNLLVPADEHPRAQPHLSSASGLVQAGRWLCVVADDEHHLGLFDSSDHRAPGRFLRLLPGDLPAGAKARKAAKPDMECLVRLERDGPGTWLLALGSGSRPSRQRGLLLALDTDGGLAGPPEPIDLAALYEPLRTRFSDLNIEGGFVSQDRFHLLQRGNKGGSTNACIAYSLRDFLLWLARQDSLPPAADIQEFALGTSAGVPLGFTDAAALPGGGWIFSAVAEDTADSYLDGACTASAIGWVDPAGNLVRMEAIAGSPKVEGIWVDGSGRLLAVTDADDPAQASRLVALEPG